jgi:NAD(P)H-binding
LRSNSKIKAALQAGHSVRALARSARRIPVDHPKLEKMAGDALEMATVKRALTGVDVVTQSLGVSAGPEIILKPTRFFSKATQVLVTAMEEAQVMQEPLQPLRPHNARTRARIAYLASGRGTVPAASCTSITMAQWPGERSRIRMPSPFHGRSGWSRRPPAEGASAPSRVKRPRDTKSEIDAMIVGGEPEAEG